MPDDDGVTRRDRNEKAGEPSPLFSIPENGEFLWEIYQRIIQDVNRINDGIYHLIPPSEYEAWFRLTDTLVYSYEYDILVAMDRAYCDEANKEVEAIRTKRQEEMQKQQEQARTQSTPTRRRR